MGDITGVGGIGPRSITKKGSFVFMMLAASVFGFVAIPFLTPVWWKADIQQSAYASLMYVTGMHIGLTYFFYLDKDAGAVMRSQWLRFFVAAPATLAFFFLAFYLGSQPVRNALWVIIGAWTIWHFQKQNFGIFSLTNLAAADKPVSTQEKFAIYSAGVAGMLFNSIGYAKGLTLLGFNELSGPALYLGWAAQALSIGALLCVLCRDRASIRLRHAFLSIFVLNWTMLAFVPWPIAFATCSFGHGIQYMLMMTMVGSRTKRIRFVGEVPSAVAAYVGAALVILVGVCVFYIAGHTNTLIPNEGEASPLGIGLIGLTFAITGVHYVLDAGIWRMRLPVPRQYMTGKLAFLFAK